MTKLCCLLLCFALLCAPVLAAPAGKTAKKPAPLHPPVPSLPALSVTPLPATGSAVALSPTVPSASDDVVLYGGTALPDEGITLAAWGGGAAEDSTDVSLSKGHALKITTLDPYQGATLTFQKPVDFAALRADKTRTLTLVLRPAAVNRHFNLPQNNGPQLPDVAPPDGSAQGAAFWPGTSLLHLAAMQGPYPPPGGGFPPPGGPFPGPGGQYPGGPYPPGMADPNAPPVSQAVSNLTTPRFVHLLLTFAGGQQTDVLRPYPTPPDNDPDQWLTLGVPLAALGEKATGPLQSIALAGDDYAVFYVGQIKVVRDAVSITCFAGDEQTVSRGDAVTLSATAQGGASSLVYTWDFDASDGLTAQATGQTVTTNAFLKRKKYTVTLTVSDADGLKTPAASTTTVRAR